MLQFVYTIENGFEYNLAFQMQPQWSSKHPNFSYSARPRGSRLYPLGLGDASLDLKLEFGLLQMSMELPSSCKNNYPIPLAKVQGEI